MWGPNPWVRSCVLIGTPWGSEQLFARDNVSWASSEAFALLLLLPSSASAQQDPQEKAVTGSEPSPTASLDPFSGEEIIHHSVMLRAIKSVPFREENIPNYVTGSDLHPASQLRKGLASVSPWCFPSPVPALRALAFSKPNKWQFENKMVCFRWEGLLFLILERGMFMWKKAVLEAVTLYSRDDRWAKICIVS